jgi:hypothetical protein
MNNTDLTWSFWLLIVLGIILLSPHKDPCYYGSEMNTQSIIEEHSEVKL